MFPASKYTPFATLSRVAGHFCDSDIGYRFHFNGQESDNEVAGTGNIMTAEFWMYDTRLGRRWNVDPVVKPWITPFHAFSNKPIINIDPNGARDDKFYDENGNLLYDDKKGNDNYVVSKSDYSRLKNEKNKSEKLRLVALKAYTSEESAAKAWAKVGFKETKCDRHGLERAAVIFSATMSDGKRLYILGNTVIGEKGDRPGVEGQVDVGQSLGIVGGVNLKTVYTKQFKGVVAQYKYPDENGSIPLMVTFGLEENTIIGWIPIFENKYKWSESAVIHTHPPYCNSEFSLSFTMTGQQSGDIAFAMKGLNVYLVPTSQHTLSFMLMLPHRKLEYFNSEADAQKKIKYEIKYINIK